MGKDLYDDLLRFYEFIMGPLPGLFRPREREAGG
jgi:hypothetical protein